jgi:hypothetical protein
VEPAYELAPLTSRAELRSPLLARLLDHWIAAGGGTIPAPGTIDLTELVEVVPYHWCFQVVEEGADFLCLSSGAETDRTYGIAMTGRTLLGAGRLSFASRAMLVMRAPLRERRPVRFASEATVIPDRMFYDIEALSLPLSSDGRTIDQILGATVARHL